jgi:hypothetical protein
MAAQKPKPKDGCVKPSRGPILDTDAKASRAGADETPEGGVDVRAQVGKPAPDFELSAFIKGGFKNIKLSDYKGKWVVLCFYPGDFTFV